MRQVQICAALTMLQVASTILSTVLFPDLATVCPLSREVSTFCGAVFSVLIALGAYLHPALLRERPLSVALLALLAAGLVLLCVGLRWEEPVLILAGSPLGGIGLVWLSILIGTSLSRLGRDEALGVIAFAFVLAYAVTPLLRSASPTPLTASIVYFLAVVSAYVLVRPSVSGLLEDIRRHESPNVLDATNPSSFLPLSSLVFITIFLFNVAYGFEALLSSGPLPPLETCLSFLPVALILLIGIARRSEAVSADALETVSGLLTLAGLLCLPMVLFPTSPLGVNGHLSAILLRGGSDCFAVLMYYIIAVVGARNPLGALTTSASAFAASWVGIGCGAALMASLQTLSADAPDVLIFANATITLIFVAYLFVALRRFSFDEAAAGVVPVTPIEGGGEDAAAHEGDEASSEECGSPFQRACEQVALEHGLTSRELDVLMLLARGRTSPVIQERLVVSHNTVKSHVRHIYAKLDVHSQQELIDEVDRAIER
ncbi:MAG: helix-turn-helix transcriptional regulator [Eggerthellaceae bacterium]|nr:helix-turn-helix transcriptional regulator [Eggerthellaceae bacterium]